MIRTLNPYPSKTDEIMSRYRPIAPKPQISLTNATTNGGSQASGPLVPEKFRQSPYLRTIWSHLQARPTRTRKRGRSGGIPSTSSILRKHHNHRQQPKMAGPNFIGLSSPSLTSLSTLSFHQFNPFTTNPNMVSDNSPVTLSLLTSGGEPVDKRGIDLNTSAAAADVDEKDLLLQLQISANYSNASSSSQTISLSSSSGRVISPRPVRPVGSTISVVGPISESPLGQMETMAQVEEIEEVLEAETIPMVITNQCNKVRMVNSAYKELVGQPECPWLKTMVSSSGKRISGEVMLRLPHPSELPASGSGFSCWVQIEWECQGKKKLVNAFSEVEKLVCESKDYLYSWRFNVKEISPSASKV